MDARRPGLERAYRATTYAAGELRLRIGERNPALDAMLARHGVTEYAYLTAWNPRSTPRAEGENREAQESLAQRLHAKGIDIIEGAAVADDGAWPPEPSVLAVGLSLAEAVALGRAFGQNAIVAGTAGGAPELVWL